MDLPSDSLDYIGVCFMIFGLGSWILWGSTNGETSIMLIIICSSMVLGESLSKNW